MLRLPSPARAPRLVPATLALAMVGAGAAPRAVELPAALAPIAETEIAAEDAAIRAVPICIASTVHSAGELGPALLYRRARRADGRLVVGYYAFFSEERPWGNNWLTWTVLPALAVDLVYTRLFLVAPGVQRLGFGPADVEGFRIEYDVDGSGGLVPLRAIADDDHHARAELGASELGAMSPGLVTLTTDTWSHHLGARGHRPEEVVYRRCYDARSIRPVTEAESQRFQLDRRARPAHVGAGG